MKSLFLSSLFAFMAFSTLKAQLSMPYVTGFDTPDEKAGWAQYRKGIIGQFQQWDYETAQSFSAPGCLAHNYPVGGTDPMDDWFVSPAFNITAGGTLDSLRYYFSGFGTPQAGDTVFIYLLNGAQDPELASSAEILYKFSGANYQNDNTWRLLAPLDLPAQAGNSYIAFRYKTINNWLDVHFDNVGISRTSLAGINDSEISSLSLYPNPVSNQQLYIQFDATETQGAAADFELYNTAGQLVYNTNISGNTWINLTVAPGYYSYLVHGRSVTAKGKLIVL